MKERLQEEGATTKSLLSLLRLTLGDLVLALLLAIVLQVTNPYFVPWFTERGFTIPAESDYGTLLATVIGVGGVFIGLYYAAISMVGGAIYARVPNNIRDLLAQERFGGAYMRFLAVFTFFGVCLLAFHSAGLKPIILAVPLFLLSAGLAVIGFVRLGTRAFYLFDPTILSHRLFEQLQQCHTQIQAGRYRWSDQSFQSHAYRRARTAVDTLATVSDIAAQETHLNSRPFAELCRNLLSFLLRYETSRKSIPTDSLWYERRYEHTDWYRTGDMATSMAHQTASMLQPQSVSDSRWIESAILPIVQRCLEINIRESRYAIVNELLRYIDAYAQHLAKEQQVKFAFDLIRRTSFSCETLIFSKKDDTAVEEPLENIGICEQLATMPINVLVSYSRSIESYGRDVVLQRLHQIEWKSKESIYRAGFAIHALKQLEWLQPRLEFEERVEGRPLSPSWYLLEVVIQTEAENLSATMLSFHDEAREFYKHWIEAATSSRRPWLAAVVISRESEYWHKQHYHENVMTRLWNDLNSNRRAEGLPWPSLDINSLVQKSEQRQTELQQTTATQSILLLSISRPESYPDFAGQFLHATGEALLSALCSNDSNTVEMLFKQYFRSNFLQFERLRPKDTRPDRQSQIHIKIAVAPLLDLIDISGYAYLLSYYHDAPALREHIAKEWDTYLDRGQAEDRLKFLSAAVSLTESAFELAHRSTNRIRWQQIVSNRLKDMESREVLWDERRHIRSFHPMAMHKNPLVRIFTKDSLMPSYDGVDIFLVKYISQREHGDTLDFGRLRNKNLEREIEREERRHVETEEI